MKNLLLSLLLLAGSAQAAYVHNATYNPTTDKLDVELTYGGCGLESFKPTFGACLETFPMQTKLTLDDTRDICRGFIRTTLSVSLDGLTCRPANVAVGTKHSGATKVSVFVPEKQVQNIKVESYAYPVQIESIKAELVGEPGFPQYKVSVVAVFGNKCTVARANELFLVPQYTENFQNLVLALGNQSNRVCTMEYAPVSVTIDLGTFTKPNDGFFSKIIVNDKEISGQL